MSRRLIRIYLGHGDVKGRTLIKVSGYQKSARQILIDAGATFDFKRNATWLLPIGSPAETEAVIDRIVDAASIDCATALLERAPVYTEFAATLKVGDIFDFGSSIGVHPIVGIGAPFMARPGWVHDSRVSANIETVYIYKSNPPKDHSQKITREEVRALVYVRDKARTLVSSGSVRVGETVVASDVEYIVTKISQEFALGEKKVDEMEQRFPDAGGFSAGMLVQYAYWLPPSEDDPDFAEFPDANESQGLA